MTSRAYSWNVGIFCSVKTWTWVLLWHGGNSYFSCIVREVKQIQSKGWVHSSLPDHNSKIFVAPHIVNWADGTWNHNPGIFVHASDHLASTEHWKLIQSCIPLHWQHSLWNNGVITRRLFIWKQIKGWVTQQFTAMLNSCELDRWNLANTHVLQLNIWSAHICK